MDRHSEEKRRGGFLRTEPPKAKEVHSHKTLQGLQGHSTKRHPHLGQDVFLQEALQFITHTTTGGTQRCSVDELCL